MSFRSRIAGTMALAMAGAMSVLTVGLATPAHAAAADLSYVGSASTAGNRTAHTVVVPAAVKAGDTLVMALATNSITGTVTTPAGWTLLQSTEGNAVRGRPTPSRPSPPTRARPSGDDECDREVGAEPRRLPQQSTASRPSPLRPGAPAPPPPRTRPRPSTSPTQNSWLVNVFEREVLGGRRPGPLPATSTLRTTAAGATGSGKISGTPGRLERPGRDRHRRRPHRHHQRRRRRATCSLRRRQPRARP